MTDHFPTRTLARFASTLKLEDVPTHVVTKAKELLLDYAGHTLSAANEEPARKLIRFARSVGGAAESRIIGARLSVASPWAAFVNGAMGHMAELDDTHRGTMSHPGDSLWASALAIAEKQQLSGAELLTAAIAGYEVSIRIGEAVMPDHYRRGWHTSGTMMVFGAAATSARLLELDPTATAWALGTAGAQASGNFAHLAERAMTKDFNCGHAAKCGVVAAMLAREGFTGPTDVLESPRGFLSLYGTQNNRPEKLTAGLGETWRTMEVAHKPYSACRYIHASIDALLSLMQEAGFAVDDVKQVTARILKTGAALVDDPAPWEGSKGLQGTRFSTQFNLAVVLIHGREGISNLLDNHHPLQYRDDPQTRRVMERVKVTADEELDRNFPDQWSSVVEIELRGGRHLSRRVDYPLGEPETPMDEATLMKKFARLTGLAGWSDQRSAAFAALVRDCEKLASLDEMLRYL